VHRHVVNGANQAEYAESYSLWPRHGNEHGNDFVFYSAVEPDSLIAVLWHFFSFFVIQLSFGCL